MCNSCDLPDADATPSDHRLALRTMTFHVTGSREANTCSTVPRAGANKKISNCPPVVLEAKIRACKTLVSLAHRPSAPPS